MLKVAIIGSGTMGRIHSQAYLNILEAEVVAVCDRIEEKGKNISSLSNANYYKDFDEMIEREDIDIVDICLPTYLHKEYALKAIHHGKHVFCEKPIALNVKDAEEIVRAAKEKGVKFSVGHVVRFFSSYKSAVNMINEGKIGIPKLIRTTRTGSYPSWSWNDWYSNYELSGGPIIDLIIHDFDWIRYNFGEIKRVYAKSLGNKVYHKDHCLVTLRLENGAIAHVEGSWAYPDGSMFGSSFEIIGTKGQVEFDSRESSPIKKHIAKEQGVNVSLESPLYPWDEPYTMEIQSFIDSIINNTEPEVTGEEAIKSLKVSLAAVESSITGNVVYVGGER
jgi:UDP-N-acetylglucosamine 3-dehydrogenase